MKFSAGQIRDGVRMMGRSLLTPASDYANGALALEIAIAQEERRQKSGLMERWFEVHVGALPPWYLWRGQSGAYKRELPATADRSRVVVVHVPEDLKPADHMLWQIKGLVDRLSEEVEFEDPGSGEILALVGGAAAQAEIRELKPILAQIEGAASPAYGQVMHQHAAQTLRAALLRFSQKPDVESLEATLRVEGESIAAARTSLAADGVLAGFFAIYCAICPSIRQHVVASGGGDDAAGRALVRFVGFGCATSAMPLKQLAEDLVTKVDREGYATLLDDLGRRFHDEGQALIDEAIDALDAERHGAALYRAAVPLYAATRIFKTLARTHLHEEQYKRDANAAEEDAVRVNHALLHALQNRTGERFDAHQKQVGDLRRTKGDRAAEDFIEQLVAAQFFYPRVMASDLMNSTPRPTPPR